MKNNVRSEVQFARTYPYYIKLGGRPASFQQAFSFLVTVSAQKKINAMTGMSVDLVGLDKIASKILKTKKQSGDKIAMVLRNLVNQFKKDLALQKTKLVRVEFVECRGGSYLFTDKKMLFVRQDHATDEAGDLFEVRSYFNQKNALIRLDLKNLKLGLSEQIIF
ncbi:MAG: hypothetical protein H7256_04845 [Bdellovibrio sp.]|nr:hypothetical protein [Bdellovibrio sp.]